MRTGIEKDPSLLEYKTISEFYRWRKEDKIETEKIIDEFVDNYTSGNPACSLMPSPPLILDTNVFTRKYFFNWLDSYHGEKTTRSGVRRDMFDHINKKGDATQIKNLLKRLNITIERLES